MVYFGPSKGCGICRTRRVKCDQVRPSCGNCVRRKQSCPGYEDTVDLMFKHNDSSRPPKRHRQGVLVRRSPTLHSASPCAAESTSLTTTADVEFQRQLDITRVPRHLPDDFEDAAISFFFGNFVTQPRDDGATSGWLEYLGGFYVAAHRDSPLSLATRAVSIGLANIWSFKPVNDGVAQFHYLKAVARTNEALASPMENKSDELLLTVLVLEFYDALTRRLLHQDASDVHQTGAAALVRHRGSLNFDTNLSKRLLLAVRSRTIQVAMTRRQGIDLDLRVWSDGADMPSDPATQMDVMAAELCVLRGRIHKVHTQTTAQRKSASLQGILQKALNLNTELIQWAKSLPLSWYPVAVPRDFVHHSILSAGFYGKACDVYECFRFAAIWNHYRNVRLGILQILEKYKGFIAEYGSGLLPLPTSYATTEMQTITDDICASVPFHLGDVTSPLSPFAINMAVRYPEVVSNTSTLRHSSHPDHDFHHTTHNHARNKGGWFMITSLLAVLKMEQSDEDGFRAVQIPKEQRDWVLGQLQRIGIVYNIDMPLW